MATEAEAKIGHTPVPWQQDGIAISAGYDKTICVMGEINGFESGYKPCQNHEANARLIAAAPDFFEAASKLIGAFDELKSMATAERIITGRSDADIRKASEEAIAGLRAAIAKAEGRS